ncbi:aminotransferase class I/II-fold pyridoxal phosphate-dependent enzyme [Solibacillus sp. FSL R7-0668]|uniref:pyridoxal phosphate-dependent aminotransferase n=1 Tax=Solibacillus sp. FSL R7-0668 TaxID=2921688 RepID=UPI0030F614B9
MLLPAHGANARALYEAMQIDMPNDVIDVSENVNAMGIPKAIQAIWPNLLNQLASYPNELAEPLRSQLAQHHQLQCEQVLVTNGAAEGLMVLAQHFQGQDILVLEPSFSEYKRTLSQQNCTVYTLIAEDIIYYKFDMDKLNSQLEKVTACYICNPNNPTGVVLEKQWIHHLVAAHPQCLFVIDEAFMDWTDEAESVIPLLTSYSNLLVVRSLTKMYALAGVRIGYVLGQQVEKLRPYLPHWNVSSIALALGSECIKQQEFVKESVDYSSELLAKMKRYFRSIQCPYSNSAANFLLFKLPEQYDADHFFIYLLKRGIVLRHTKNYAGLNGQWFRIAVKTEEIWARCQKEMDHYVKNYSLLSPLSNELE